MKMLHASYYDNYVSKVGKDPLKMLSDQHHEVLNYIEENIENLDHAYAEGKWTIREVICHIVDTEIVFGYRLLRIARGDKDTKLPGFDQDLFMANTDFSMVTDDELIAWFDAQRMATMAMLRTVAVEHFDRVGVASDHEVSAGSLLYMLAGHCQHHLDILKERYS